jgi:hypothetical protein
MNNLSAIKVWLWHFGQAMRARGRPAGFAKHCTRRPGRFDPEAPFGASIHGHVPQCANDISPSRNVSAAAAVNRGGGGLAGRIISTADQVEARIRSRIRLISCTHGHLQPRIVSSKTKHVFIAASAQQQASAASASHYERWSGNQSRA